MHIHRRELGGQIKMRIADFLKDVQEKIKLAFQQHLFLSSLNQSVELFTLESTSWRTRLK